MKFTSTVFLGIIAHVYAIADVYQGSFEWRQSGAENYSIALFKFDTATGIGTISDLKPNQGAYVSSGFWSFELRIKDSNLYGDKVIVSSFDDLVNFSTRQIPIRPTAPYSINGNLFWRIYSGNAYGSISDDYQLTDGSFFNAYYESGMVRNFTHITSPSISIGRDDSSSYLKLTYTGILQESTDLTTWTTVNPQPKFLIHYVLPPANAKFWRTVTQ